METHFEKRLLQLIRENEVIYDQKPVQFKTYKSRRVWEEIAKELCSDVDTCRRTWRSLRSVYRKIKTKNAKSGVGEAGTLMSKWCYLDDLTFLDKYEAPLNNSHTGEQQTIGEIEEDLEEKESISEPDEKHDVIAKNQKIFTDLEDNLVQEVRRYKVLWDKSHPDYANIYQKFFAWQNIAKNLKLTPKICRNKWMSMQSRYRQKTKAYEDGSETFTENRWQYYGKMAFINQHQKYPGVDEFSDSNLEEVDDLRSCKGDSLNEIVQMEKETNSPWTKTTSCESTISQKDLNNVETNARKRMRHDSLSESDAHHKKVTKPSTTTAAVDTCSNYMYTLGTKLDDTKIPLRVKYDLERRVGNLVYEVLAQVNVDDD